MTKRNELVLHRDTLVKASQVLGSVVDDDTTPDELRNAAVDAEFALSEALCYQSHGADGERSIRLIPVGFRFPQYYTDMVEEMLLDLGEDVVADNPAWVVLAKHCAALVDDALYSTDFRLDCYGALNVILARLADAVEVD